MGDRILIHACPERMWYVDEFLIPSLQEQGIKDIDLYQDDAGKGNLWACIEAFEKCGKHPGDTWHLQDDVLICHDFAEQIAEIPGGIVACGFCHTLFEPFNRPMVGMQPPIFMFNSFPCIRIPNETAAEFVRWFKTDAIKRDKYQSWVASGIHDDGFWHDFYTERHPYDFVYNIAPALVEHVDWIIGGSVCNTWRGYICRASYWDDEYLIDNLIQKTARRRSSRFFHNGNAGHDRG